MKRVCEKVLKSVEECGTSVTTLNWTIEPKTRNLLASDLFYLRFQDWQEKRALYKTQEGSYGKYRTQKEKVQEAFRDIASFCTVAEVQRHPKIQNDAEAKVPKYLKSTVPSRL